LRSLSKRLLTLILLGLPGTSLAQEQGTEGDPPEAPAPEPPEDSEAPAASPEELELAALEEQLAALEAQMVALREEQQRTLEALEALRVEGSETQARISALNRQILALRQALEETAPEVTGPEAPEPEIPEPEAPVAAPTRPATPASPPRPPAATGRLPSDAPGSGAALLTTHATLLGAHIGATLGYVIANEGDDGAAASVALAGGAVVGVSGGLASSAGDFTRDYAAAVHNGGLWGTWTAYQLGTIGLEPEAPHRIHRLMAMGSLGGMAGTGAAMLTGEGGPPIEASFGATLAGMSGWNIAAGVVDLAQWDYSERDGGRAGLALAGAYTLGGVGLAAHWMGAPLADPRAATLGVAEGLWLGSWSPLILWEDPDGQRRRGGTRVGAAAGYLAATASAPWLEIDRRMLGLQTLGFTTGNLLGAGIPLATGIEGHPRGVVLPMTIGAVAGHIGGALVAPSYQLDRYDRLLLPLLQGWAAYQAIGWGVYGGNNADGRQAAGFALTSLGAGTALAWGAPAVVSLAPPQTTLAFTGSLWGTWYGAWGSYLLDRPAGKHLGTVLWAGDVGLVAAAAPSLMGWRPSWSQLGILNGAGAAGAGLGALVGVLASPDAQTIGVASLVGTTVGLSAGAVVVGKQGSQGDYDPVASVPAARDWRLSLPVELGLSAAPWRDEDGGTGAYLQLNAVERRAR
jgi:hypothetical protein